MKTLLELARETDAAITQVKKAFGAPGDWGYGCPAGDSLFKLYEHQAEIRAAIDAEASGR